MTIYKVLNSQIVNKSLGVQVQQLKYFPLSDMLATNGQVVFPAKHT